MDSLLDLVLPHLAEASVRISREQPDDPIQFMADFLRDRGNQVEEQARERARVAFYSALDEANAREKLILDARTPAARVL